MPGKIRFGMVGTGFIADWVLAGARQDARFEAVAICSRTQERADAFAAKHGIPHTFTLLEEMAASPLVDAVYIATPNFLHASQSILCMRHGKHVLCEKPLASNAREARQMVAVARECGVTGARMMGGGFGGCTINLVKDELYDNFIATAKEKFNAKYGHEPKVYDVVISDGSRRLE